MVRAVFWNTLSEKNAEKLKANALGESVLHSDYAEYEFPILDFDNPVKIKDTAIDGSEGGTLFFDVVVDSPITPEETRKHVILNKIDTADSTVTLDELIELEKIRSGFGLKST